MKKLITTAVSLLLLCGCTAQPIEPRETASVLNKDKYKEEIESILTQRMWNYNTEDIVYTSDTVANSENKDFDFIVKASHDLGLEPEKAEGKEGVTAQVPLLNMDRSSAGTAYIQFVKDKPVCGYYVYNEGSYSLKNKYPFEVPNAFKVTEDTQRESVLLKEKLDNYIDDYCDIYNGKIATIDREYIKLYTFDKGFKLIDSITYNNYMPMDVAVCHNFNAILLGTVAHTITNECSFEVGDDEESYILKSDSIHFVNDSGDAVLPALNLDLSTYTSIDFDNDKLILGRNKGIDVYKLENGQWIKEVRHSLNHFVSKLVIDDIDNDGVNEYVVADGVNLYIYRPGNMLELLWCTNYDLGLLSGQIYVGDINNDGVKEIYSSDINNISYRYVLIDGGFALMDNNIDTQELSKHIIGDFDNDGICDYICIGNDEGYIYKSSSK